MHVTYHSTRVHICACCMNLPRCYSQSDIEKWSAASLGMDSGKQQHALKLDCVVLFRSAQDWARDGRAKPDTHQQHVSSGTIVRRALYRVIHALWCFVARSAHQPCSVTVESHHFWNQHCAKEFAYRYAASTQAYSSNA